MRIYLISISHIPSVEADEKFMKYIDDSKFDWWRYIPLMWGLATPDETSTNDISKAIIDCYGLIFCTVLEVTVLDVGGMFPISNEEKQKLPPNWTPFKWFTDIRDSRFTPRWVREKEKAANK